MLMEDILLVKIAEYMRMERIRMMKWESKNLGTRCYFLADPRGPGLTTRPDTSLAHQSSAEELVWLISRMRTTLETWEPKPFYPRSRDISAISAVQLGSNTHHYLVEICATLGPICAAGYIARPAFSRNYNIIIWSDNLTIWN